jgi:hypothetical protein
MARLINWLIKALVEEKIKVIRLRRADDGLAKRCHKAALEVVLSQLAARVWIALELLDNGKVYVAVDVLNKLKKVLPTPTDHALRIARRDAWK